MAEFNIDLAKTALSYLDRYSSRYDPNVWFHPNINFVPPVRDLQSAWSQVHELGSLPERHVTSVSVDGAEILTITPPEPRLERVAADQTQAVFETPQHLAAYTDCVLDHILEQAGLSTGTMPARAYLAPFRAWINTPDVKVALARVRALSHLHSCLVDRGITLHGPDLLEAAQVLAAWSATVTTAWVPAEIIDMLAQQRRELTDVSDGWRITVTATREAAS